MSQETIKKTVLNVGSGGKNTKVPPWFNGWEVTRLDIDPKVSPDWEMDARKLCVMPIKEPPFDAVYCLHNLEHYSQHDAGIVIKGMRHVLKKDGFVDIQVPNVGELLHQFGKHDDWDLDTFLYQSSGGAILVRDMLYGYERQREFAEHPDYMLHRNAFSARTLSLLLNWCGFGYTYAASAGYELRAIGFMIEPDAEQLAAIELVAK